MGNPKINSAKRKVKAKRRGERRAVTDVNSALTVLPVPLGLRYLLGSPQAVKVTAPLVGHTSAENAKQDGPASLGIPLLALLFFIKCE